MKAIQTILHYNQENGRVEREMCAIPVQEEAKLTKQIESNVVGIYPAMKYQVMEGLGCALTESSCFLLSRMDEEKRRQTLECWFGEKGIGARFIRIPIDSCDYSLSEYQAVENPIEDPELLTFSMERNRQYMIPVIKEAIALAGHEIEVLLSPWSPPAEWKTLPEINENDAAVYGGLGQQVQADKPSRCFGGRLKKEYYASWADYLVKYVQAYLAEGVNVTMLSVQNEASAATNWDSCVWSSAEESCFVKEYLYPKMQSAGLTEKVGIYIWDHNKERMVEHVDAMMKDGIENMVQGFAYHWYSGDHFEALSMMKELYPDKILMHSESCGLHIPGKPFSFEVSAEMADKLPPDLKVALSISSIEMDYRDAVSYAHDIIGDMNHGMNRWIDWNLCVNRKGGPRHVPGGFAAPIIAEDDGSYTKTVSYEYLMLISRIIKPGSIRLGVATYSDDVEATAVKREDGTIGVLFLNKKEKELRVAMRFNGYLCEMILPANTLSGMEIEEK